MNLRQPKAASLALALTAMPLTAQAPVRVVAQLNLEQLALQAEPLLIQARAHHGYAAQPVLSIEGHAANLTARTLSGGGEIHRHLSDLMIVLSGEGTELTGGEMVSPVEQPGGEVRAARLDGATAHLLHKGDILQIPAGTPHQATLAPGQAITLLVVKIAATESPLS